MSDTDFCDDLLAPRPMNDISPLQDRLREQTTRALRRRRWLRRLSWAAALAACYLAGILTMALRPAPAPRQPPLAQQKPTPAPKTTRPSAVEQEWAALENPELGAEPYRAAGDRYLTEEADPQAALRCYTTALDRGGDEALAVDRDDSWLLILIKDAREKEKTNAKRGG
jgi:hypothetical protein